jgi:hypothetical protein
LERVESEKSEDQLNDQIETGAETNGGIINNNSGLKFSFSLVGFLAQTSSEKRIKTRVGQRVLDGLDELE